jgi:Mg/Co/Ni transporter MgtE
MNNYDRRNLEFILSMDPDQILEFFESMPADDIFYAIELIQLAKCEAIIKSLELIESAETDYSEARAVLERIQAL